MTAYSHKLINSNLEFVQNNIIPIHTLVTNPLTLLDYSLRYGMDWDSDE